MKKAGLAAGILGILLYALIIVAIWVTLGYVAYHFITKYW